MTELLVGTALPYLDEAQCFQACDHFMRLHEWYGLGPDGPKGGPSGSHGRHFVDEINATGAGSSVQSFQQKYSDFPKWQISLYPWPSRLTRGALRGRHGRWVRDAMHAAMSHDE